MFLIVVLLIFMIRLNSYCHNHTLYLRNDLEIQSKNETYQWNLLKEPLFTAFAYITETSILAYRLKAC